jgi:hypothetical protein
MCPIYVSCTLFNAWMRGWHPVRVPRRKRLMAGALPCRPRGPGSARVRPRGPLLRYQDARLGESAVHAALLCEMWIDLAHETGLSAGARHAARGCWAGSRMGVLQGHLSEGRHAPGGVRPAASGLLENAYRMRASPSIPRMATVLAWPTGGWPGARSRCGSGWATRCPMMQLPPLSGRARGL